MSRTVPEWCEPSTRTRRCQDVSISAPCLYRRRMDTARPDSTYEPGRARPAPKAWLRNYFVRVTARLDSVTRNRLREAGCCVPLLVPGRRRRPGGSARARSLAGLVAELLPADRRL